MSSYQEKDKNVDFHFSGETEFFQQNLSLCYHNVMQKKKKVIMHSLRYLKNDGQTEYIWTRFITRKELVRIKMKEVQH